MWKFVQSLFKSVIAKTLFAFIFGAASSQAVVKIIDSGKNERETKIFVMTDEEVKDKETIIEKIPVVSYSLLFKYNADPIINDDAQYDKLDLNKNNKKWIDKFIYDLNSCANNKSVVLGVYGYASRAEFVGQDITLERSNEMNIDVAMARAIRAVKYISQLKNNTNVKAAPYEWENYLQMRDEKPVNDELGEDLVLQEYLNRSVEIRIIEAGDCKKKESNN